MQDRVLVQWTVAEQEGHLSIPDLKRLLDSSIVQLQPTQRLELPAFRAAVYLFLRKCQEVQQDDEYVVQLMDQLLVKESLLR